jgi:transposase
MPRPRKYPEELLDRGVRLVFESGPPIAHVAADLSIHPETLRKRVRQAETDAGPRNELLSSEEHEELKRLRGEVRSCAALTRSSSQRASRRHRTSHPGVLAVQSCAALLFSRGSGTGGVARSA